MSGLGRWSPGNTAEIEVLVNTITTPATPSSPYNKPFQSQHVFYLQMYAKIIYERTIVPNNCNEYQGSQELLFATNKTVLALRACNLLYKLSSPPKSCHGYDLYRGPSPISGENLFGPCFISDLTESHQLTRVRLRGSSNSGCSLVLAFSRDWGQSFHWTEATDLIEDWDRIFHF